MLADTEGALHVMAATTGSAGHPEALQLKADEGPAIEAFRGGEVVIVVDVRDLDKSPVFREVGLREGYRAVHAIPLKVADVSLGAMCLFSRNPGASNELDTRAGQALADVMSIGILNHRLHSRTEVIVG